VFIVKGNDLCVNPTEGKDKNICHDMGPDCSWDESGRNTFTIDPDFELMMFWANCNRAMCLHCIIRKCSGNAPALWSDLVSCIL